MNQEMFKQGFTHSTIFHADDVFSTALCKLLFGEDFQVTRGMSVPKDFDGIVYDLGRGKFDHHQSDRAVRSNGIPYASFGLLWREFGSRLVAEEDVEKFDKKFIEAIDKVDNLGGHDEICDMIATMNPYFDEEKDENEAFFEAVDIAKVILKRAIGSMNANRRAQKLMIEKVENMEDRIVVLDKYIPWMETVVPSEAEFIVFPSLRGGYCAQTVPKSLKNISDTKIPFPEAWAGQEYELLPKLSGVETMCFAHNGRFLITCQTVEDCIKACKISRKIYLEEKQGE